MHINIQAEHQVPRRAVDKFIKWHLEHREKEMNVRAFRSVQKRFKVSCYSSGSGSLRLDYVRQALPCSSYPIDLIRKEAQYVIKESIVKSQCRFDNIRVQFNEPLELVRQLLKQP